LTPFWPLPIVVNQARYAAAAKRADARLLALLQAIGCGGSGDLSELRPR
jgi:hypothetical protein